MRTGYVATLAVAAISLAGCTSDARSPRPPESTPSASASPAASNRPTVAALASTVPLQLIVNLGPAGWTAKYNRGAGIAVTPANWADAYEIAAKAAATEIGAEQRNGLQAAATEQWSLTPRASRAGYSRMRLTIRQYASVDRITDAWWKDTAVNKSTPAGIDVPDGMRVLCSRAAADVSADSYYYVGAHNADCLAFIADTTVVYLSRVEPDATAVQAGVVAAMTQWFNAVMARVG